MFDREQARRIQHENGQKEPPTSRGLKVIVIVIKFDGCSPTNAPSFPNRGKEASFSPCPGLPPAAHVHRHQADASKYGKQQTHRVRQPNHLKGRPRNETKHTCVRAYR